MEILTLKVSTQLMHAMGELQLYSTVWIGWKVARGMDAMGLSCALTVRYERLYYLGLMSITANTSKSEMQFCFLNFDSQTRVVCAIQVKILIHFNIRVRQPFMSVFILFILLEVLSIRSMQKDRPDRLVEQLLLLCWLDLMLLLLLKAKLGEVIWLTSMIFTSLTLLVNIR